MKPALLLKGFEVELFTGKPSGENVGVASEVARQLPGFVTEPDRRNLEYITEPEASYDRLEEALLRPRRTLRQWLAPQGLTLLPGSTLSLGDSDRFERSDPTNPYHSLIEATYGTRVVTASVHINLGLTDPELLFAAVRLIRCEAALLLSLSASSPFIGGQLSGQHSQRWRQFPLTPEHVPLFINHRHYIDWVEEQLATGAMRNERHLWTSVRPNGPDRPHSLNRLELRICDLVTDPADLIAITVFLELRVMALIEQQSRLDPLCSSELSLDDLAALADRNDAAASRISLEASLNHWQDGRSIRCRDWIMQLLESMEPTAERFGLLERLQPIRTLLKHGNQAMRWLDVHAQGHSISALLSDGAIAMEQQELVIHGESAALG